MSCACRHAPKVFRSECPTAEERRYLSVISTETSNMAAPLGRLGRYLELVASNPTIITNQEWKDEVDFALSSIEVSANNLRAREAPTTRLRSVQHYLASATEEWLRGARLLRQGAIDGYNVRAVEDAGHAVAAANTRLSQATDALDEVCP